MSVSAKKGKNGLWHIQYRYTDWTGERKKSTKRGFRTKKEAEDWLAHFMLQRASDMNMTLEDFWKIYMEDMENLHGRYGKAIKEDNAITKGIHIQ